MDLVIFPMIWLMLTTTVPFAVTHVGAYSENYNCEDYSIDFLKSVNDKEKWGMVVGQYYNENHVWIFTKVDNNTIWFEPQTGMPIGEPKYQSFMYNPFMCCDYYNEGIEVCNCSDDEVRNNGETIWVKWK